MWVNGEPLCCVLEINKTVYRLYFNKKKFIELKKKISWKIKICSL